MTWYSNIDANKTVEIVKSLKTRALNGETVFFDVLHQSGGNAVNGAFCGTDAMIEVFDGLSHGFGLGTGTVTEGWINNAVAFWERNMK